MRQTNLRGAAPHGVDSAPRRVVAVALLAWSCCGGWAWGQEAIFFKLKRIDQDKLLHGDYPLRQIVENGRHLFSTPFTKDDGYGEGGRVDSGVRQPGPREADFQKNLLRLKTELCSSITLEEFNRLLNFALPHINAADGKATFPYYRLNGLDSQSCFECHNSIGSARLPDTHSLALTRKQSTVGGPAGSASNAFINPDLPYHTFEFVRNPPHVFGTGYAQELAEEMSHELLAQKVKAIKRAVEQAGTKVVEALHGKTTAYGTLGVTYRGNANDAVDIVATLRAMTDCPEATTFGLFEVETSGVVGVSHDLIVRPFQWKGIASNERNFVKDACQFHFGIQAREKNKLFNQVGEVHDGDADGHPDELSLGDVSALSIFTMTIRPPTQILPPDRAQRESAERGRQIFSGQMLVAKEMSCSSCHTPSLVVASPIVVVRDPRSSQAEHGPVEFAGNGIGLSAQRKSSTQLPTFRRFLETIKPAEIAAGRTTDADTRSAVKAATIRYDQSFAKRTRTDGYAFNLSDLQPVDEFGEPGRELSAPLSESLPRLAANADGSVDVPLFTDFKRHKMGALLSEPIGEEFRQATDVEKPTLAGVPEDEFLTRPLWGVADTGPWLHDGRAQSLLEAILLHDSPGSDATPIIAAFRGLLPASQADLIEFLKVLRLPIDPRYGFDNFP